MPYARPIHILWDASHIWGLMAWRALRAFGLPCRLSKGHEIAEGVLLGKSSVPMLLVPGGNARQKAAALGPKGRKAICDYVQQGGFYLGFCGGAGLALTSKNASHGLGLCPWVRAPYTDRLQHLVSGHIKARIHPSHPLCGYPHASEELLPVWWPGRFQQGSSRNVDVLARGTIYGEDFWLGDLPLATIPKTFFDVCKTVYGIDLRSTFLWDMPLVVTGRFGQGSYILSYSHLETPMSSAANSWLSFLLKQVTQVSSLSESIPTWDLDQIKILWPQTEEFYPLHEALHNIRRLLDLGCTQQLFFRRTPWLWGWRSGLPGAALNTLHTLFAMLLQEEPTKQAIDYWRKKAHIFAETLQLFCLGAEENLLSERIGSALASLANPLLQQDLKCRREMLFGQPPYGGGIQETLVTIAEELLYLSQKPTEDA